MQKEQLLTLWPSRSYKVACSPHGGLWGPELAGSLQSTKFGKRFLVCLSRGKGIPRLGLQGRRKSKVSEDGWG